MFYISTIICCSSPCRLIYMCASTPGLCMINVQLHPQKPVWLENLKIQTCKQQSQRNNIFQAQPLCKKLMRKYKNSLIQTRSSCCLEKQTPSQLHHIVQIKQELIEIIMKSPKPNCSCEVYNMNIDHALKNHFLKYNVT